MLEFFAVLPLLGLLSRELIHISMALIAQIRDQEIVDLLTISATIGQAAHTGIVTSHNILALAASHTRLAVGCIAQLLALKGHAARP